MTYVLRDLRFALRQFARQRSFAIIAIATLALGIGATTTCFSVLNAVALRPIPFPAPDKLISLHLTDARRSRLAGLPSRSLSSFQALDGVLSGAAAYASRTVSAASPGAAAERVPAAAISGDLFSVLGVPPEIGRPLSATDAGTRVAVIGHELWVRLYGSDPNVLSSVLSVDGEAYAIVGVAAAGFSFPEDCRVWLPLDVNAAGRRADVIARIQPDVSLAKADAALAAATTDILAGAAVDQKSDWIVTTIPLRQAMLGTKQRNMALFLLTAAGLVLLIACANLAGLMTAQLGDRRYEIALRAAIGASRIRIVRQLVTESALLAMTGGVLGVLLAQWGVAAFDATLGKPRGAEWVQVTIDGRVLLFSLLASTGTAFLFGLMPAIAESRVDLRSVLQEDRSGPRPAGRRARAALVASQIAIAIGLVAGALSVVLSSTRFEDVDPGFRRDGLITVKADLAGPSYEHPEQRLAFAEAAVQRLRTLPDVSAVAAASHVPLVDRDVPYSQFIPEGANATGRPPSASLRFVDEGYLAAMGIPVRRGRGFTSREARDIHARVVLVDETMARRHWPDRDPLGARVRITGPADLEGTYEIIGVTGDVAQRNVPAVPENQIYLPLASARDLTLVARTASDPSMLAVRARDAVRSIDPTVAITAQSMAFAFRRYVMDRRLQGIVLGTIGLVAVLVAALGVYGIVALMVGERSREFAIRRALGASNASVMRLVIGRAVTLSSLGTTAGLLIAVALTAFLSSIFLGVRAFDPMVLAVSCGLLALVGIVASWWPARRAMRFDPVTALKQ